MIPIITYKSIADLINSAQDIGIDISLALFNFREDLDNSEIIDDNIDKQWLYAMANETYSKADTKHNTYSIVFLNFVFELQTHVNSEYSSVNNFLRDNSTPVLETFAAMSDAVGFTIDPDNIQATSDLC